MYVNIHSVMLVQSCVGKLCKLSEYHKPEGAKEAVWPLLAPWSRLQCTDLAQASGTILKADEAASVTLPELKLLSILIPLVTATTPQMSSLVSQCDFSTSKGKLLHATTSFTAAGQLEHQCTYPVYCRRPAAGLKVGCLRLSHMAPCP